MFLEDEFDFPVLDDDERELIGKKKLIATKKDIEKLYAYYQKRWLEWKQICMTNGMGISGSMHSNCVRANHFGRYLCDCAKSRIDTELLETLQGVSPEVVNH